mmetsp:Transcript_141605/g.452845  ORF Transcript_141605/g.452845 Transcript_141605/m.452845 type:complete len:276 (-) Transcript_141605:2290-3117(-)
MWTEIAESTECQSNCPCHMGGGHRSPAQDLIADARVRTLDARARSGDVGVLRAVVRVRRQGVRGGRRRDTDEVLIVIVARVRGARVVVVGLVARGDHEEVPGRRGGGDRRLHGLRAVTSTPAVRRHQDAERDRVVEGEDGVAHESTIGAQELQRHDLHVGVPRVSSDAGYANAVVCRSSDDPCAVRAVAVAIHGVAIHVPEVVAVHVIHISVPVVIQPIAWNLPKVGPEHGAQIFVVQVHARVDDGDGDFPGRALQEVEPFPCRLDVDALHAPLL